MGGSGGSGRSQHCGSRRPRAAPAGGIVFHRERSSGQAPAQNAIIWVEGHGAAQRSARGERPARRRRPDRLRLVRHPAAPRPDDLFIHARLGSGGRFSACRIRRVLRLASGDPGASGVPGAHLRSGAVRRSGRGGRSAARCQPFRGGLDSAGPTRSVASHPASCPVDCPDGGPARHADLGAVSHPVNPDGEDLSILRGMGDGSLRGPVHLASPGTPFAVIAADLDEDGVLDLVSANWNSGTASVLLQEP